MRADLDQLEQARKVVSYTTAWTRKSDGPRPQAHYQRAGPPGTRALTQCRRNPHTGAWAHYHLPKGGSNHLYNGPCPSVTGCTPTLEDAAQEDQRP